MQRIDSENRQSPHPRGQSWYFPLKARVIEKPGDPDWIDTDATANLSSAARDWLAGLGLENPDANEKIGDLPWLHALAISWSPKYLSDNNGNLGVGWPRNPMPADSRIEQSSADLGRIVSDLLDNERGVAGVTEGEIAKHLAVIGRVDGDDLRLISGKADAARDWSASELDTLTEGLKEARIETERGLELLGAPIDVALNAGTFWRGIPERVWDCRVGGYRPLSRWINQRKKTQERRASQGPRGRRGCWYNAPNRRVAPHDRQSRRQLRGLPGQCLPMAPVLIQAVKQGDERWIQKGGRKRRAYVKGRAAAACEVVRFVRGVLFLPIFLWRACRCGN